MEKKPQPPEPIINAQLILMPKAKPQAVVVEPEKQEKLEEAEPQEPEQTPKEPATRETAPESSDETDKQPQEQPVQQSLKEQPPQETAPQQAQVPPTQVEDTTEENNLIQLEELPKATDQTLPSAVFNPRSDFKSLLAEQDKQFFDSISRPPPAQPQIKSSSTYSEDGVPVEAIFETAHQISPTTRVINYNGKCVMIERKLDHNGFSYHSWSGYSGGCGKEDEMKKALKMALDKHVKKRENH